jgi:hypothetical protein
LTTPADELAGNFQVENTFVAFQSEKQYLRGFGDAKQQQEILALALLIRRLAK